MTVAHRPGPGRAVPASTYRVQVEPRFTFDQAAAQADHLAALGVTHVYLSPVLQPVPGSTHGYDVVRHDRFNEEAGGEHFAAAMRAFREAGLGVVVDVVPNHMATPTPAWLNPQWWALLREGRTSPYAAWFDVDWDAEDGRVLLPVLGTPLEEVLHRGELAPALDGGPGRDAPVLRYFDHELPLRAGTESLPLADLVAAQHYRLCFWREGDARLNYRRFFDVTTLAAVRVEDAEVFDATHRLLLGAFRDGLVDGFRIDHPDGLADPRGYLDRLARETGDAWVVVEKILEGAEELVPDWSCAGTTGYDTLREVGGVFVDPGGAARLTELAATLAGQTADLGTIVVEAKREVVAQGQAAEVSRLMRLVCRILPGHSPTALRAALEALLVAMPRYRAYLHPGEPADPAQLAVLDEAREVARRSLRAEDHDALDAVTALVRGQLPPGAGDAAALRELVVRFQQTTGPVMAKGVEDTAFYRHVRLTGLNEVGGDPDRVGVTPGQLHEQAARLLQTWPTTMTTLTTHDTKRSEDVRARLAVLSELPDEWGAWVERGRELAGQNRRGELDPATEYLLWQTVAGAWPIDEERLRTYATKAVREAKVHTSWIDEDPAYEDAVGRFVTGLTTDPRLTAHLERWTARTADAARANTLGQKLLQLVQPGVPDVYQGAELVVRTLVDPDNRRPVDYRPARERLARLDRGEGPRDLDDEKLLVTSRALRLRRDHPEWFTGPGATYAAVPASSEHVLAVARGDSGGERVVAVVTRLSERLAARGGWGAAELQLPPGKWLDLLTGRRVDAGSSGAVRLTELLPTLPVALIVPDERA